MSKCDHIIGEGVDWERDVPRAKPAPPEVPAPDTTTADGGQRTEGDYREVPAPYYEPCEKCGPDDCIHTRKPIPIPELQDLQPRSKEERMRERERISPTPRPEEVPAPDEVWVTLDDAGSPNSVWDWEQDARNAQSCNNNYVAIVRYVRAREGGR